MRRNERKNLIITKMDSKRQRSTSKFTLLALLLVLSIMAISVMLVGCDPTAGTQGGGECMHIKAIDKAVEPTCTTEGLTEGSHCKLCGEVFVEQKKISALGHEETIIEAVAPTCFDDGLSEGKVCERCGEVLLAQETIDALGHDTMTHDAQAPTCTEVGWESYETCTRCDYTTYVEIPAGHTEVVDEATATCTGPGLTEGSHCSACGEVIIEQV
ncbi:MAG: hypothetical protein IKA59_03660, partial [Clostridia bacterium]|nr:hypothetical protein [Clostridia bacterium]